MVDSNKGFRVFRDESCVRTLRKEEAMIQSVVRSLLIYIYIYICSYCVVKV